MDSEHIRRDKSVLEQRYGPWTAHNIHLTGDLYTMANEVVGDEWQLRRVLQIIADLARQPWEQLRVLDLACLEGLYAVELARQGARVVAVEGREANLAKARFAREVLALENLELHQDDVRNLSRAKYGVFDVVLCSGILYHLDVPDVFHFLEQLADVCTAFAIIDTHVGVAEAAFSHRGRRYWGQRVDDHPPDATEEEMARELWRSLGNRQSFFFTRPSLYNFLAHAGFTSVYETHHPREVHPYDVERVNLVAVKGEPATLRTAPLVNGQPVADWPEAQ